MGEYIGSDDLGSMLRDIVRRLGILESTSRLSRSSIRDGFLELQDEDGNVLAVLDKDGITELDDDGHVVIRQGRLPNDGTRPADTYGIAIFDGTGTRRFEIGTEGLIMPRLTFALTDPAAYKVVSSGSFVDCWINYTATFDSRGVEVVVPWATDPGTTGELQIASNVPTTTDPQVLPAGSSGVFFARWLHGGFLSSGPMDLRTRARKTGGGGNVYVFPSPGYWQNPIVCAANGGWTV